MRPGRRRASHPGLGEKNNDGGDKRMFKICLFDLDDTLVRTDDLEEVRLACKRNEDPVNIKAVNVALRSRPDRQIYSQALLEKIRKAYPKLKLGIFTRSPRSYATTVLAAMHPGFVWDIVVAYEDVRRTKPHGDGIDLAMEKFGVKYLSEVILVGDSDSDVRAAYNCGCMVVIDRSAWPGKRRWEHWGALEKVPDAIIGSPDDLIRVLAKPNSFAPELERLLSKEENRDAGARFDKINHFVPRTIGGDSTPYPIHVCGRSFTHYDSLQYRRGWHELTQSIADHKDASTFSETWIAAIRSFIFVECRSMWGASDVLVTVVPHRPERKARLETLLAELGASVANDPIAKCQVAVAPGLLAFKDGVMSQHNDHLNQEQRFENVRDHLYVASPRLLMKGASVLVLDDVVTTGASLIYAVDRLKAAGAGNVKCLAIAKSIGDVL